MTSYQQLLDAVEKYYGSGSDQWAEIAKYGIGSEDAESILSQVPGVNIVKNSNGKIRSYNFSATENIVSSTEQAVNSNAPAVLKSFNVPANTGLETVTTPAGETVKHMTFRSGMSQAGNFVFGEVAPALAATAAGITLGKTVDKLLYSANPDFWNEHGMSTLDPDTWGNLIGTDTTGGKILNTILGTTPDGKTQAYMDQNALAYMALYLQNKGAFNDGSIIDYPDYQDGPTVTKYENSNIPLKDLYDNNFIYKNVTYSSGVKETIDNFFNTYSNFPGTVDLYTGASYSGTSPFTVKAFTNLNKGQNIKLNIDNYESVVLTTSAVISGSECNIYNATVKKDTDRINFIGYKIFVHSINASNINTSITQQPSVEGIGTQDNAKTPDLSGVNTVDETLAKLKEQYPELFEKAISQDVVQPDGSTVTYTYVPVSMPELDPDGNPVSSTSTQNDPQVNPETATQPLLDLITKIMQKDPPNNPPDTGGGKTPVVVPPTGSASALYAIYNPTLEQINSFGAWLWSDNFIEQIKKLFNDPMQAIIGLHKVYATPATSGSQHIKVGYLDSGVSANVVSNQYTTIDCGTVSLSEYFYNVFDYAPYTDINLYLPFIGIVGLDVADVMRSSIHIIYHVDVLSGACLAEVEVIRDSAGGTLYQYTGNASVTLPISSGSYMGIVSSIAGIAGGIAGTIASGGSALPLIASSAGSILNARTKVEHSGGFSGNAGAMGSKIPYLIISRPQVELANNFEKYIGYPTNITTTLESCSGFVNVLECHLENINATDSELSEIESLLKGGIIV